MVGRLFSGGWSNTAKSPYPTKSCHFCNLASIIVPPHPEEEGVEQTSSQGSQSLPLSTGSESNWFCSRCQCWNRYDEQEEGGMKSWESTMADESVHSVRYTSTPNSHLTKNPIDHKSIFCHTCQTNQTLVLSMISNYDEDTRGIHNEQRFKRWRDDLEKRYPPICVECRDEVEDRLRKADKHARALIWNNLLQRQHIRKAYQPVSDASLKFDSGKASQAEPQRDVRNTNIQYRVTWVWYVLALGYLAAWMSELNLLSCIFQGSSNLLLSIRISSLCWQKFGEWDPKLLRHVKMAASNPNTAEPLIEGMGRWRRLHGYVLIIRYLHCCQLFFPLHNYQVWISAAIVLAQVILTIDGYLAIKIHLTPRVSLRSKDLTLSLQVQRGDPDLSSLSLQDEKPGDQQDLFADRNSQPNEDDHEEDDVEDSMDWSPTLTTQTFLNKNAQSFTFGPRRFFEPANDTGLEDLLKRNLGLQDSDKDEKVPMDLDTPVDNSHRSLGGQGDLEHLANVVLLVGLITIVFLQQQKVQQLLQSSFLEPIREWWSSAFALARQRTEHQALWRPSFEEVANAE